MPAGSTYTPIATTTLGSAQSTVTFSSIAGTYTDLIIVANAYENVNGYVKIRYNNDSGSNYSRTYLYGNGSSALSGRQSNEASHFMMAESAVGNSNNIYQIMNYSNSTTNKTSLNRQNNAGGSTWAVVYLWRSTAAINRIDILSSDGTAAIQSGSTFTLYGIASA